MKTSYQSTIFIVDDDPFFCNLLNAELNEIGYEYIEVFENGEDCLGQLSQKPAVIFLDYHLGKENGIELLQLIKNYDSEIEVVFCTAHENLTIALEALKFGSLDYLLKTNLTQAELERILK